MVLKGDTEPAKYMLYKPYDIERRVENFDWEQARWLRFERHFHSVGRTTKNTAIGLVLIAISVAVFRHHRRVPDDVSKNVFDWSALPNGDGDASGAADIDVDP
jgi:hypothetical protein